ncbi:hypothetical protein ACLOJK_023621 [Asimina triloba]
MSTVLANEVRFGEEGKTWVRGCACGFGRIGVKDLSFLSGFFILELEFGKKLEEISCEDDRPADGTQLEVGARDEARREPDPRDGCGSYDNMRKAQRRSPPRSGGHFGGGTLQYSISVRAEDEQKNTLDPPCGPLKHRTYSGFLYGLFVTRAFFKARVDGARVAPHFLEVSCDALAKGTP